jgi:hypothetical protein
MNPTMIVKIESGVVSNIYSTHPVQVLVVDYDMIEGGESAQEKIRKSVHYTTPDSYITPELVYQVVEMLVMACRRPADDNVAFRIREYYEAGAAFSLN